VHVTSSHGANEAAFVFHSQREGHENRATGFSSSDCNQSILNVRMLLVGRNTGTSLEQSLDQLNRKTML
jgi:hypothetical protein